jgi:hypothetical protein
MGRPTKAELDAVRQILFEPQRQKALADDARSISVLMNLQRQRQEPVVWWYPGTRQYSRSVLEAAGRCRNIAAAYQQMSQDVQGADVNSADKALIRSALGHIAAWWLARADAWSDEKPPPDAAALAQAINEHFVNAYNVGHKVAIYFREGAS